MADSAERKQRKAAYDRAWREANPEKVKGYAARRKPPKRRIRSDEEKRKGAERASAWRKANPEECKRRARASHARNREARNKVSRKNYRERKHLYRPQQKKYFMALRREFISAYGGACHCCGETLMSFLTLEHMNNDGAEHRRRVGSGYGVYYDLRRRGWPKDEGITVACFNCNEGRRVNSGGPCPHEAMKRFAVGF